MTVLSDRDIKKRILEGSLVIDGLDITTVSLASVDLKLGNKFKIFKTTQVTHIDTRDSIPADMMETIEKKDSEPFILHPSEFALGSTKEYIKIPDDLVGRLDGRSSLGRLGVVIHSTAGSVDPGFEGYYTATVPSLPGIITQGKTKDEALRMAEEAIELHIEDMLEDNEIIPLDFEDAVELEVKIDK